MPLPDAALAHVVVVLVRPIQSGNVGAAARAIANHGLGGLVLVDPPAFDPDEARWMAPGTEHVVHAARIVATVEEAVADRALVIGTTARPRRWDWPVWSPPELVAALAEPGWRGRPTAILFGPEDAGLANEDLRHATALLRLPTTHHSSINLAQAVTVTAAWLAGAAAEPPPADPRAAPAPVRDQERLVEQALGVLDGATYLAGRNPEQVRGTLFRLLNRARPSHRELAALMGMVGKLRWAVGQLADR